MDTFYSILLYIPEATAVSEYVALIQPDSLPDLDDDPVPVAVDSPRISRRFVQNAMKTVNLLSLTMEEFLRLRVLNIDRETGLIDEGLKLLMELDSLREWRKGIIETLLKMRRFGLDCELKKFEDLHSSVLIQHLNHIEDTDDIYAVICEAILPFVSYKGTLLEFGSALRDYLAVSGSQNMSKVLAIFSAILQHESDELLIQMVSSGTMIACYSSRLPDLPQTGQLLALLRNTFINVHAILEFPNPGTIDAEHFKAALTVENDPMQLFVTPSVEAIEKLQALLDASSTFGSIHAVLEARLGDASTQQNFLTRLLSRSRPDTDFRVLRDTLLGTPVMSELLREDVDAALLRYLLLSQSCELAKRVYVTASPRPLSSKVVEQCLLDSFTELFDNAKSISRRDLSSAGQVLSIIHPKHTNERIRRSQLLVDTLIELSGFRGTNEFMPIQIRSFSSLEMTDFFSRIVQERSAYKKHFRLLGLYQNLSLALQLSADENQFREIIVNSALSFDDLAYAIRMVEGIEDPEIGDEGPQINEAWKLLYQVCKYPSDDVLVIQTQLDLIGKAVSFCPDENINELMLLFRRLRSNAESTRESWDPVDSTTGHPMLRRDGSTMSAQSEESTTIAMPEWRLFEAAQAATRTARQYFPQSVHDESGQRRVRKRDQLANLVGGVEQKFSSGLGWLIGADQDR